MFVANLVEGCSGGDFNVVAHLEDINSVVHIEIALAFHGDHGEFVIN